MELIIQTILIFVIAILIAFYPRAREIKERTGASWFVSYYWAITISDWY